MISCLFSVTNLLIIFKRLRIKRKRYYSDPIRIQIHKLFHFGDFIRRDGVLSCCDERAARTNKSLNWLRYKPIKFDTSIVAMFSRGRNWNRNARVIRSTERSSWPERVIMEFKIRRTNRILVGNEFRLIITKPSSWINNQRWRDLL